MLSVTLPIYNTKEQYLIECIDSILHQTYDNFELIIVNDASTDKNLECCVLSYTDPRIRYYRNEVNRGISYTRNKIISLAKGEYIAVVDHDDINIPTRFQKQVDLLETHPEVGVVGSLLESFPKKKQWIAPELDKDIKTQLFHGSSILHPTTMIRCSLFTEYNIFYEEAFSPAEDYMLWCRLMKYTQFYTIQENLVLYRKHENNTSEVQAQKMAIAHKHVTSIVKEQYPEEYLVTLLIEEKEKNKTLYITFLGFIPLLKREKKESTICWYLFNYILIMRYPI